MADDCAEDEVAASLARLRMFLAPHKPARSSVNGDHQASDIDHADPNDSNEDLSSDQSTLAEEFSSGDHAREPCVEDPAQRGVQQEVASSPVDERETIQPPVPATTAVATVSPITPLSKEYTRVKYLLQCSLPGFRVHDDMVMWDMKNPALATQYEAHANGLLELDAWVEVDKLSAAMGDQPVGITSPATRDLKTFATGNIAIDPSASAKGRKQLVLCKIAVGRSLAIERENDAVVTPLPPGYHSYYLCKRDQDSVSRADVTDSHGPRYRHEYILNDALQILPQYLVRFSYSALEAKALQTCVLCEQLPASLQCKACDAELCAECDKQVHSANKLVERHKRTALQERSAIGKSRRRSSTERLEPNQGPNDPTPTTYAQLSDTEVTAIVRKQVEDSMSHFHATCQLHEGKKIEFYCPICAIPVCVNCKMVGDHSIGDKGAHRLLPIAEAYDGSLRESFKSDPLVESRRSVIENKLALISQWETEITRNREQVEAAIKQQYEQALASLDDEVKKKTSVLKGEALEFVRQLQHIEWLDDCLDERRGSCSVVEFLSTWSQHKSLRAEQRDFPVSSHAPLGGEQVKADLQLVGHLQVVAGDQVLPRLSFSGSDFGDPNHQDDRCGPLSPRGSIGTISSPPTSVRRGSDNDIRRKLLSMRSVEKRAPEPTSASTASPSKALAGMGTLSPEGRKMMEEIRNDLFARRTVRSSSGSLSPSVGSPNRSGSPSAANMRMFSIQPTRGIVSSTAISAPPKQRATTAAWTALLRHELAVSKENGSVAAWSAPPESSG